MIDKNFNTVKTTPPKPLIWIWMKKSEALSFWGKKYVQQSEWFFLRKRKTGVEREREKKKNVSNTNKPHPLTLIK